jgi:hypothetical protein
MTTMTATWTEDIVHVAGVQLHLVQREASR